MIKALVKKMFKKGEDDEDRDKGDKDKKEKTKEVEKVVFPKFPQPKNLRIIATGDLESAKRLLPLSKVWDKDTKVEDLKDTAGFATLDAKVLSAVPNILEGEFARQIDSFKEREAHAGRLVRGRQVLAKLAMPTLLPVPFMVHCTSLKIF